MTEATRKASVVAKALELALQGVEPAEIAQTSGAGGTHTTAVLKAHGYPSTKEMSENWRQLRPLGDLPITFDIDIAKDPTMTDTADDDRTIEGLLAAAEQHSKAAIRNLAERIRNLVDDLESRIEQAAADEQRKARIAALKAEIASLTSATPTKSSTGRTRRQPKGVYPCKDPGCDRVLDTPQGAAAHHRRAHEGFDPNAAQVG